jgi:hypothetical protein
MMLSLSSYNAGSWIGVRRDASSSINDIYAVEMRAHHFSDADEKGRDRLNVGHVLAGVGYSYHDLEENSRGRH